MLPSASIEIQLFIHDAGGVGRTVSELVTKAKTLGADARSLQFLLGDLQRLELLETTTVLGTKRVRVTPGRELPGVATNKERLRQHVSAVDAAGPQKVCRDCNESYPATADFFWRHSGMPDGLFPNCKTCGAAKRADRIASEQRPPGRDSVTAQAALGEGGAQFRSPAMTKLVDRVLDEIEREDEARLDEMAQAVFGRYSTHVARIAAIRGGTGSLAQKREIERRVLLLEEAEEIKQTARYVLWEISDPGTRQQYLTEYRRRHGQEKAERLKKAVGRLAKDSESE